MIPRRPKRVEIIRAMRMHILQRDGGICQYCNTAKAITADHIVPQLQGGPLEPFNLTAACASCNAIKGPRTWIPLNLDLITQDHPEWKAEILERACIHSQETRSHWRKGISDHCTRYYV